MNPCSWLLSDQRPTLVLVPSQSHYYSHGQGAPGAWKHKSVTEITNPALVNIHVPSFQPASQDSGVTLPAIPEKP